MSLGYSYMQEVENMDTSMRELIDAETAIKAHVAALTAIQASVERSQVAVRLFSFTIDLTFIQIPYLSQTSHLPSYSDTLH